MGEGALGEGDEGGVVCGGGRECRSTTQPHTPTATSLCWVLAERGREHWWWVRVVWWSAAGGVVGWCVWWWWREGGVRVWWSESRRGRVCRCTTPTHPRSSFAGERERKRGEGRGELEGGGGGGAERHGRGGRGGGGPSSHSSAVSCSCVPVWCS